MAAVIRIDGSPALAFYDTERPTDIDLAWPRLAEIQEIDAELRTEGGATPSARVRVDNGDGALSARLAAAPLLADATIERDGVELFAGVVAVVEIGATALFELEA